MNTENFHDALNYLDDDLIRETEELRRGQRVLYREPAPRRLLRALAPAACVALLVAGGVGLAGRNSAADSAAEHGPVSEGVADSQSNFGINEAPEAASLHWQQISQGRITLSIPDGWEYEKRADTDGSYALAIRPIGAEGYIVVGYFPQFGVCGTGLETEDGEIAGIPATIGYYDGDTEWSFITFSQTPHWFVVLNEAQGLWVEDRSELVAQILNSIIIGEA